jgi:phosphate transport system substrate-binding protein
MKLLSKKIRESRKATFSLYSVTLLILLLVVSLINNSADAAGVKGTVRIDGSSTVFPITEAIAEEFRSVESRVRVNIGVSGTGGGFKKFSAGEIDINDASRKIKDKEVKKTKANKIPYIEIPVAYDGLTVVINPKNSWAGSMTTTELKKLWDRDSNVKTWADIRKGWPARKIKLYGPGTDSGTFDYFSKAINGKSGRSRSNYTKSEDDNVLVKGVAGDVDALGYFGYAYYKENSKTLKAVEINGVSPTPTTINSGKYKPLSRPIFIYVNTNSYKRPEVKVFVDFYLKTAKKIVEEVGYIPLPDKMYEKYLKSL